MRSRKILILKPTLPNAIAFGGQDFNSSLGHKGGALMMALVPLWKCPSERAPISFTTWAHREKKAVYDPGKWLSADTKPDSALILNFQPPELWEDICLLFKPPFLCWLVMPALAHEDLEWTSGKVGTSTGPGVPWPWLFFSTVLHMLPNMQACCTTSQEGNCSQTSSFLLHIHLFTKDLYSIA